MAVVPKLSASDFPKCGWLLDLTCLLCPVSDSSCVIWLMSVLRLIIWLEVAPGRPLYRLVNPVWDVQSLDLLTEDLPSTVWSFPRAVISIASCSRSS